MRTRRLRFLEPAVFFSGALACALVLSPSPSAAADVTAARIVAADSEPHNWLSHGRTYDEQRYSPLSQIGRESIGELGLAWAFTIGSKRGLEATPIVVDGVMYATGTWSILYALDAKTGEELWSYNPKVPRAKARDGCCDVVNRGVAVWKDRVYLATFDGRLVAIDAETGKREWEVATVDASKPYTITGAPRIVRGRVIIGNGGAEFGVRGYFSAYDANTGGLIWRFYTVPASAEGPHEHPELEMAAQTWSKDSLWESGLGGTVWDSFAYDPELDLLYIGVGNSSVYNRSIRSPGGGDNLFLTAILAIKPETGRLAWHYQTTPGEHWDYTATQHMVLADLKVEGRSRKVLMQAPKNGFFYVLDRETGELLSADPYTDVSWATHVDLSTGRPVEREEAVWSEAPARVTPGIPGGHNWHPMSYSPQTGYVYIPTIETFYDYYPDKNFEFVPGRYNTAEDFLAVTLGVEAFADAARANSKTGITAWDPVNRRRAWRVDHDHQVPGGLLSTAGGLLFQGGSDGTFTAFDTRDGSVLWRSDTGVGVMAAPVSYGVDGEQYVAVLAGLGGSHGGHFARVTNANTGRILAYKLGGKAVMPEVDERPPPIIQAPEPTASKATVDEGRSLYAHHCLRCHGMAANSSGLYPDLRHSAPEIYDAWDQIVIGGLFSSRGMASFDDVLTSEDADAIRAYVIERARTEDGWLARAALWLAQNLRVPARWLAD